VVAAAGTFGTLALLRNEPEPATEAATAPPLWPEHDLEAAREAQAQADGGSPDHGWRLDAEETTRRFAVAELGWGDAVATVRDGDLGGPGPVTVVVAPPPPPCPDPGCPPWLTARGATLTLERLVRPDTTGIWSVTEVEAPATTELRLPLEAGQDVPSGTELTVSAGVPEGARLVAGYAYYACVGTFATMTEVRRSGEQYAFSTGGASMQESPYCPDGSGGESSSGGDPGYGQPGELQREVDGFIAVAVIHGGRAEDPWYPMAGVPRSLSIVWMAVLPVHFVPAGQG
jgi:hypothetical protein